MQYATYVGAQVWLAPIIIARAGAAVLGAYASLMQVIAYLSLVDLGFSVALSRFLSQASSADEPELRFRQVLSTGRSFFLLTNLALGILLAGFSVFVDVVLKLPASIAADARRALLLMSLWVIVRTPLAAYNIALTASQRQAHANLIATAQLVARLIASIIALRQGLGLFGLVTANLIAEALASTGFSACFRTLYPARVARWGIPDRALFREMFRFSKSILVVRIAAQMTFNAGTVIVAMFAGPVAASKFFSTQTPTSAAYGIALRLPDSSAPAVNELWATRRTAELIASLLQLYRMTLFVATGFGVSITLFNSALISIWLGPAQYGGNLMTASLGTFVVVAALQHIAYLYAIALGAVRTLSRLAVIEALANLVLALTLYNFLGLGGISLALVIALLPKTLYLYHHICVNVPGASARDFIMPTTRFVLIAGISAAASYGPLLLASGLPLGICLALRCGVAAFVYCLLGWVIGLDRADRSRLQRLAAELTRREPIVVSA